MNFPSNVYVYSPAKESGTDDKSMSAMVVERIRPSLSEVVVGPWPMGFGVLRTR